MLLILTDRFDSHADTVVAKLKAEDILFYRFNLDVESLKETYVSFRNGLWKIRTESGPITSDQFTCVWCRRSFVELTLEEQNDSSVDFKIWKNEWNSTLTGFYNSIKSLPWLTPLRKAYKGENKYYQMELAERVGFKMPETLITNDKEEVSNFLRTHPRSLFKLMSQEMYDMGEEGFKGLYTNIITIRDLENFGETEENPIVLQEYIEKDFEVRYTKVNRQGFACKIESQMSEKAKSDWRRYDIAHTPHSKMTVPADVEKKVDALLDVLGLEFGALDFIVTPSGEWYFLEINCMGQWLWIEQLTGLPISNAIVDWVKAHI